MIKNGNKLEKEMSLNEKRMSTTDKKKIYIYENITSSTNENEHKMEIKMGMNETEMSPTTKKQL